jgi:hypothetical protein
MAATGRARLIALAACASTLAPLLAGCAGPPPETPAEAEARRGVSCTEAGFEQGTPDFRLCLLLQQTNERLAAVERRLAWIDRDTRLAGPYLGPRWWW